MGIRQTIVKATPRVGKASSPAVQATASGSELTTANYGWIKPTVGASDDVWGVMINSDLDSIDTIVHAISTRAPPASQIMATMDALTIITQNIIPPLSRLPVGGFMQLIVNGRVFCPIGAQPAFSVSGTAITWLSTSWSVMPGDEVIACYE